VNVCATVTAISNAPTKNAVEDRLAPFSVQTIIPTPLNEEKSWSDNSVTFNPPAMR
jgi:hypothetical protein